MFPLATDEPPQSAAELAAAIESALEGVLRLPRGRGKMVKIKESDFPDLDRFDVDVSGAAIDIDSQLHQPKPGKSRQAGPHVATLSIVGDPLSLGDAELEFALNAKDAQFEYARDKVGDGLVLMLKSAGSGDLSMRITRDDLERAIFTAASIAAERQGVTIKDVHVQLSARRDRANSIDAEVDVTAKKFLTANIKVRGSLDIDDSLHATLSNLECEGEGMVGSLVCGFLRPQLERIEGRSFSLQAVPLGKARVRDVQIKLDSKALQVQASFG